MTLPLLFAGVLTGLIGMVGLPLAAQSVKVDHFSQEEILAMAKQLETKAASGNGSASKRLDDYPNHYTMVAVREKSGGAEVHANFADIFYIVEGRARLITGGKVLDPKSTGPGEVMGSSLEKGVEQLLNKGDVVHIPAGLPHQLLLAPGEALTYFVLKVKEK